MLFESVNLGGVRAENRLVRAATFEGLADADGMPTRALVEKYEALARGGAGCIITGFAYVTHDGAVHPGMLSACSRRCVCEWRALVEAAHGQGVPIVLQLVHGGSAARAAAEAGGRIIGPSAVENPKTGAVPAEATHEDIARIAAAFAEAAAWARDAGFDGVEVHAAHGYLFSQFLNPLLNQRTDEYGGAVENRARFACEVLRAIRTRCDEFPVWAKLNGSDGVAGGLTEEDAAEAARLLAQAGASVIEVSGAWRTFDARAVAERAGEPLFAAFAVRLARELGETPVILTGGCRDAVRLEALAAEGIAAFGLCRPLICEPDLPFLWRADPAYRPRCTSCNACSRTPGLACVREG